MFQLSKWYLDLTTPDGVAVICYAARLRWGLVRLRYASILVAVPGEHPEEAFSVRQVERPMINRGTVRWRSEPLDVDGEWHRRQPAIRETLLRDQSGAIRWLCRMPLATAEVRWGDRRFSGTSRPSIRWYGSTGAGKYRGSGSGLMACASTA